MTVRTSHWARACRREAPRSAVCSSATGTCTRASPSHAIRCSGRLDDRSATISRGASFASSRAHAPTRAEIASRSE
eukprot:scaffold32301_cov135-Isochrysis_galbana.AAC.23